MKITPSTNPATSRSGRAWLCGTLLMVVALAGCSTTTLTDSWQASDFDRRSMNDVLVVAMTNNSTNRILFEEGFIKALRDRGIRATASHTAIGNTMPDRASVTAYVERNSVGYVVVSDYNGSEVTKWVVPEQVRTYYTGPYYPSLYGYWDSSNTITMTRDSYVDQRETVMLSTSIFAADTGELVWVGRSESFDVDSIADEAGSLAGQVVSSIR